MDNGPERFEHGIEGSSISVRESNHEHLQFFLLLGIHSVSAPAIVLAPQSAAARTIAARTAGAARASSGRPRAQEGCERRHGHDELL